MLAPPRCHSRKLSRARRVGNQLLCLAVLLLTPITVHAQVNTENLRKADLPGGIHNTLKLDFNLVSGNSDFFKLTGGFRTDFVSGDYYTFGVIQYQRGIENEEDFINKGFIHLRLIRRLNRRLRGEFFGQKEFNDFILLRDRTLIGGGLRFDLLPADSSGGESRLFNFSVGIGTMWENEELDTNPLSETRFFRATNYASLVWQVDKRITLSTVGYYQFRYRNADDYRILLECGSGFDLTESLTFLTSLNLRYDNDPPEGIKRHDIDVSNGVRFSF